MEDHPRWHRHNRAGPQHVVMEEAIVDPAPDLSAGGEEGEVGYAPMQHATQSHTNNIPSSPTHTTCPPLTSFPAVHLSQYVASLSHRYLGNYLISLDNDGQHTGQLSSHTQLLRLVQEGSFMSPVSHKFTQ